MKTFIVMTACMWLAMGSCCPERNKPAGQSQSIPADGKTSGRISGGGQSYDRVYEWPEQELISHEFGPV